MTKYHIDKLDLSILRAMSNNARIPYLEIARECGVSGASIHQRAQRLNTLGIIKSTETHVNPNSMGLDTCAFLGIFLNEPGEFDAVLERLCEIPEIVECHCTSGKYDLLVKVYAKNNDHLLKLIQTKLQMRGIARTETLISFREVFHRAIPIEKLD